MSLPSESRIPEASTLLILSATLLLSVGCAGKAVVDSSRDDGEPDPPAPVDAGSTDGGGSTDAGGATDAAADANDQGPPCPMDWGVSADVVGATPSGSFQGQYAWLGFFGGECGGLRISVAEVPGLNLDTQLPAPPLLLFGKGKGGGSTFEGAGETDVAFITASTEVYAKGWLELTHVDPWPQSDDAIDPAKYPRAEGTITVDADGLSLKGSFTAPYCAHMNIYCP